MKFFERFKKTVDLFELKFAEKNGEFTKDEHQNLNGLQCYDARENYREIKFVGIEVNQNGTININYEDKYFPVDLQKWLLDIEEILHTGKSKDKKLEDYKLEVIDKLEITRDRIYGEKYKVKSEILDNLLDRNVSFIRGVNE